MSTKKIKNKETKKRKMNKQETEYDKKKEEYNNGKSLRKE
jgi:hypothetical protein